MSDRLFLSYPNRVDPATTVTGGSWLTTHPASNTQQLQITKLARSTNILPASTLMNFALQSYDSYNIRVVALANHNLINGAMWRISLGTTVGGTDLYTSGWITVNPAGIVYLPSYMIDDPDLGTNYDAIHVIPEGVGFCSHVTVEIDCIDATGCIGGTHVQIGRVFIGNLWQPEFNADYGLQDGVNDLSTSQMSPSGVSWQVARRKVKTVAFNLSLLTQLKANYLADLYTHAGTVDEMMYLPGDPTATSESGEEVTTAADVQRYGFIGRLAALGDIGYPSYNRRATQIKLEALT